MVGTAVLAFSLLSLTPGNPAEVILTSVQADYPQFDEAAQFMKNHDLDSGPLVRLTKWFIMLSRGDLGKSLQTGEPVADEFWDRFPATLELAVASTLLAAALALPLGILSAVKRNSLIDHGARAAAMWGVSMPNFWLGLVLILVFGVMLGWLPTYGYGTFSHLIMPTLTLGTSMTAILMRLQRAGMLEVLNSNYVRTARAKGASETVVIGVHAFRNTLIPVATIIGVQFAHLLSGAVIVEKIFAWPGIGAYLLDAVNAKDYPVIQGFVLMIALIFVLCNLAVDVIYALLDPRIRYESAR